MTKRRRYINRKPNVMTKKIRYVKKMNITLMNISFIMKVINSIIKFEITPKV